MTRTLVQPRKAAGREELRRARIRGAAATARADAAKAGRDVSVSEVLARTRRRARYELRDVAQGIETTRPRLAGCGRKRIAPEVALRLGDRGAGYLGLEHCESIWACPVCAAAIRSVRANEIQDGAARHLAAGGGGLFITLTLPHGRKDKLRGLLAQVTQGWGKMLDRRAGREWKARLGLVGYIRAVEITHGGNGWHPHLHLLALTEAPVGDDTRDAFTAWLQAAWMGYASDRNWKGTAGEFGADVQDIVASDGLAKYVAKVQDGDGIDRVMGAELARADLKGSRAAASRTPFELLADIATLRRDGTDPDGRQARAKAALFAEFVAETSGLSALRWSKGLRDRLGVAEVSDAAIIATEDLGDNTRTVVSIPAVEWMVLCRQGARGELLDVTEREGAGGAAAFIRSVVLWDLEEWARCTDLAFGDHLEDFPAP